MRLFACSAVLSAALLCPITGMAKPAQTLHARIEAAYTGDPSPVYLPEGIGQLKALYDEARTVKNIAPDDRVRAIQMYAQALNEKGDAATALTLISGAIALQQKAGRTDTALTGDILRDKGSYQMLSNDPQGALETQGQALALMRKYKGDDSPEVGSLLCAMAYAYGLLGRLGDALSHYDAGLKLMSAAHDAAGKYSDPANYAAYLGNYAGQLRLAGDAERSLIYSREALRIGYQMPEGDRSVSWGMFNIASSLLNLGRYAEAEALYRQALDFTVLHGGKVSYETGSYSYNLARALIRQGKAEEGEALLQNALAILQQVKSGSSPYLSGVVLDILGQLAYEQGDAALSESRLNESLSVLSALGKRGEAQKATAQADLALTLFSRQALPEALKQVDAALIYFQREKPPHEKGRVGAETLRALILSRMGKTDEALSEASRTAAVMRARLSDPAISPGDQSDVALSYALGFTRLADIALSANQPEQAFVAAQMASFTEIAATSQSVASAAALTDARARDLMRDLVALQTRRQQLDRARSFALGKSEAEVTRLNAGIAEVDSGLLALRTQLTAAFPAYERLSQPQPITTAEAMAGLRAGQAVVIPLSSDDRTLTLVLTGTGLSWDQSPLARTKVNRDVRAIREAIDADPDASGDMGFNRGPAYELGAALFSPKTLRDLKSVKEVQILGAGPVMSLPFGLLLTSVPQGRDDDPRDLRNSAWLIKRFAFSVKPALTSAAGRTDRNAGGFAGIGAPIMRASNIQGQSLPDLPRAMAELQTISEALHLPQSQLITGAQATEAHVKSAGLDRYAVIAFATHGLISGDLQTLREPALVLTPPAQSQGDDDGLLTASEVTGLRLNAHWVILSACNTGSAREAGASGYTGLAKAFRQAGAQNVMVSLWPVRDDVAAPLSIGTVRAYAKGQSQAGALQKATLGVMKDRRIDNAGNPVVWAPFSLVSP
jgi:CHAT domain-containing protein